MELTAAAALEDWGERNLGDVGTLTDFVGRCRERGPAKRFLLVFWGDGGRGWRKGGTLGDATSGGDALELDEVRGATKTLGQVDVVAYDASHMASIEVRAALGEKHEDQDNDKEE